MPVEMLLDLRRYVGDALGLGADAPPVRLIVRQSASPRSTT